MMLTDWPTVVLVVLGTRCSAMLVRRSFGSSWKRHGEILVGYGKQSNHFYTRLKKASGFAGRDSDQLATSISAFFVHKLNAVKTAVATGLAGVDQSHDACPPPHPPVTVISSFNPVHHLQPKTSPLGAAPVSILKQDTSETISLRTMRCYTPSCRSKRSTHLIAFVNVSTPCNTGFGKMVCC
jgi:hypothetical protein